MFVDAGEIASGAHAFTHPWILSNSTWQALTKQYIFFLIHLVHRNCSYWSTGIWQERGRNTLGRFFTLIRPPSAHAGAFYCDLCGTTVKSMYHLQNHMGGKRHKSFSAWRLGMVCATLILGLRIDWFDQIRTRIKYAYMILGYDLATLRGNV